MIGYLTQASIEKQSQIIVILQEHDPLLSSTYVLLSHFFTLPELSKFLLADTDKKGRGLQKRILCDEVSIVPRKSLRNYLHAIEKRFKIICPLIVPLERSQVQQQLLGQAVCS